MKIKDILKETDGQAVITNYQPGHSVEVTMPDGTLVKKDLIKNPNAIGKDEQGNPVFNLASMQQDAAGQQPQTKPITTGTQVSVNTDPSKTMGQEAMGDNPAGITAFETQEEEDNDLIGSGKDGDIGGDPTDEFINQVIDKGFERSARGKGMSNSPVNSHDVLPENDELKRWLTIARLR